MRASCAAAPAAQQSVVSRGLKECPAGETNSGDHDAAGIAPVCKATVCEANKRRVSLAGHRAQQSNSRGKQNDFRVATVSGSHPAERV